jgi:hypothetical protein
MVRYVAVWFSLTFNIIMVRYVAEDIFDGEFTGRASEGYISVLRATRTDHRPHRRRTVQIQGSAAKRVPRVPTFSNNLQVQNVIMRGANSRKWMRKREKKKSKKIFLPIPLKDLVERNHPVPGRNSIARTI